MIAIVRGLYDKIPGAEGQQYGGNQEVTSSQINSMSKPLWLHHGNRLPCRRKPHGRWASFSTRNLGNLASPKLDAKSLSNDA